MSVLDWAFHTDWTCSEQLLRSKHWSFSLCPPSPAVSHLLPVAFTALVFSEHHFSHALVSHSTNTQHTCLQFIRVKSKASITQIPCVYSAVGIKGFSAEGLETGLSQGDSKSEETVSEGPFSSHGNRSALLAYRPKRLDLHMCMQRYGMLVLFVCWPWRTEHWVPLRLPKSLHLPF